MKGRMIQLDILRAVAILMVFGAHLNYCSHSIKKGIFFLPTGFIDAWYRSGWAGVDLFFVLSGFLVSGLLFKEHKKYGYVRLGRFLLRRGFKIYPAFYVMLLITLIVKVVTHAVYGWAGPQFFQFLCEALFVQNYGQCVWLHTWSLAVEEHFYLTLGLGILLLSRLKKGTSNPFDYIPLIFVIVAPLVLVVRCIHVSSHPYYLYPHEGSRVNGIATHLRLDSLLFGVLISYITHYHKDAVTAFVRRFKFPILVVSCLCVSTLFFVAHSSNFFYSVGYTIIYLGFGGILLLSLQCEIKSDLAYKLLAPIRLIGFYSYSIYLWHWPLATWWTFLQRHLQQEGYVIPQVCSWIIYMTIGILFGIGMAKLVEVPFLRIRDRLFPSLSG